MNALDVSRWQGDINWSAVKGSGYQIAIIKVSGGDDGLYIDSKAQQNFNQAQANGFSLGTYHFAGGTDARAEAEYFVNACSPLDENQVLVLDWEVQHPDPVGWCKTFIDRVKELTGTWCMIYMNGSTLNTYDWTPVTTNSGVWVAWYGTDPNADLPVKYPYIMHQYTSTGSVNGIAGNVDLDAWYYDIETWNKYGWHAQTPAPEPPAPTPPAPEPAPEPPKPDPIPPVPPKPAPIVINTSGNVHVNTTPKVNIVKRRWNAILYFFDIKVRKP